jgi:hypothetical protein
VLLSLLRLRQAKEALKRFSSFSLTTRNLKRAKPARFPQKKAMNITKNLGMLLLAIYLILVGITMLFHIAIPAIVMGILALVAGILILIGK